MFFRSRQEKNADLASPPGYNPSVNQVYTESSKENDSNHLIIKKSWDLALGPLKQVRAYYNFKSHTFKFCNLAYPG